MNDDLIDKFEKAVEKIKLTPLVVPIEYEKGKFIVLMRHESAKKFIIDAATLDIVKKVVNGEQLPTPTEEMRKGWRKKQK